MPIQILKNSRIQSKYNLVNVELGSWTLGYRLTVRDSYLDDSTADI